ncbi:isoprenylcysteine carboxylmethyltransferase family protein [Aggregicoccus sp. 17bor-14]|uniref:methyltransferase family protein n=1 Tax=Myxococcaceae TaxID=31 RepID=UPI00129C3945|nr:MULTISPECIES: isoprenylcysteine carboxylmethyltransferase family protein [Myxococcaceae]MBF5043061.1 isoprenylcysteine carboxylmethyltransferase family protein [Simulacricoccus sp. 17bor-14]MRI88824.1 isoprenylcysteine carboxylmethyltransferase family protein [Aggregicoccus sp. 17bor-14]
MTWTDAQLDRGLIALALVGWVGFGLGLLARRRGGPGAARRAPLSWVGILVQGAGVGLLWGWRRPAGTLLVGTGVLAGALQLALSALLVAFALWLGPRAVAHLGKQWSLQARMLEGHELVTTGPYALVRHPIYTALLALLGATALAQGAPLALLLGLALYAAGTALRVRTEEQLLEATFGPAYAAYRARVPAVLPWPRAARAP